MRFFARTAILTGIILLASQTARATTLLQTYSNLTAWEAAVAELGVDTFEGIAPSGGSAPYDTSAGYADLLGIDFVGNQQDYYSLSIFGAAFASGFNFGTGATLGGGVNFGYQPSITANLPAGTTAVALYVMTVGTTATITLTANYQGTQEAQVTVVPGAGQETFAGFTFSAPITSLVESISGAPNNSYVLLDNFAIGTADADNPVPEPLTMLLVGTGLLVLARMSRIGPRLLP